MSVKTIRPGVSILERMITLARTGATALTSELVGHLLTGQRCSDLDRLLVSDAGLGMTRLAWLTRPAVEATASAVLTAVGKLTYLRNLDAHTMDLSMLPAERRRFLATVGRRSTVQALMRREERRYPILLALVAQSAVDQLDEVIALFDQAVSARESRARTRTDQELAGCFAPPAAGTCERSCGVQGECERGAARPARGGHRVCPLAATKPGRRLSRSQGAMAMRGAPCRLCTPACAVGVGGLRARITQLWVPRDCCMRPCAGIRAGGELGRKGRGRLIRAGWSRPRRGRVPAPPGRRGPGPRGRCRGRLRLSAGPRTRPRSGRRHTGPG